MARFLEIDDSWIVVFWRSFFAAAFLITFMLVRDGASNMMRLFLDMGWPGVAVG
ncbi:hypothetical protein [Sinorhizobium terangae]|uniref:hypothetical protein n=1 Tax=Sinorhizobium terangae TaxID=110322 RepID=UPI0024B10835|nr:hypothetical protein [Sinorhizobium terangae]WFU47927.1 hypothetical protein QA637_00425 [Sinorhizobium terangae]